MRGEEKKALPMAEIRVLDLADEKASFCSKLLADLGAGVIKVERPGGDPSRRVGPFWENLPHPEKSLFFWYNNSNKRGITLDLEHPLGRPLFLKLVKKADIVVESFAPGYLKGMGLGYEVLKGTNPRVILVSVTGFGQTGPRSQYKSCDLIAAAFGGQMHVSGSPASPPLKAFGEQSYYTASLFAAVGALLALRRRAQRGVGEHLDLSLQEAVTSSLEHVMVRYFYDQVIPNRRGGRHWDDSFCIVPCKDGTLLMTPLRNWDTLVEWMEGEGMAEDLTDEKYRRAEFRSENIDHVIDVLQRWTRTHTAGELSELGQLMHFPWAPVLSPRQVLDNPQLKARRFFIPIHHPEIGADISYPSSPLHSGRPLAGGAKRAPLIGEDNLQIYREDLGLSDEEIAGLVSMRAI